MPPRGGGGMPLHPRRPARGPLTRPPAPSPWPQPENIVTLTKAAGIEVEPYWPALFAKLIEKKSVEDFIVNVGAGEALRGSGGARAAAAAAAACRAGRPPPAPRSPSCCSCVAPTRADPAHPLAHFAPIAAGGGAPAAAAAAPAAGGAAPAEEKKEEKVEEEEDEVGYVLRSTDWGNWFCTFRQHGGPRQLAACCMARVMALRCGAACQPTPGRRQCQHAAAASAALKRCGHSAVVAQLRGYRWQRPRQQQWQQMLRCA